MGQTLIHLHSHGLYLPHDALVIDSSQANFLGLLGLDFVTKYRADVLVSERILALPQGRLPLRSQAEVRNTALFSSKALDLVNIIEEKATEVGESSNNCTDLIMFGDPVVSEQRLLPTPLLPVKVSTMISIQETTAIKLLPPLEHPVALTEGLHSSIDTQVPKGTLACVVDSHGEVDKNLVSSWKDFNWYGVVESSLACYTQNDRLGRVDAVFHPPQEINRMLS
jgi:hypothetical protein